MRSVIATLAAALTFCMAPLSACADVRVRINKGSQTMHVYVDGELQHVWPVSTGRGGYGTPGGTFRPQRLERRWYSTKYRGASMHNAIFFHGGYAIHATTDVGRLGRPASHGCVRLDPGHAAALYAIVRQHGSTRTKITVAR